MKKLILLFFTGVALLTIGMYAAQDTATQAAAGRALYQTNCAGCHMPDLGGRNEAPALAGTNFMGTWGSRSTRELLNVIRTTMPPGRAGTLPAEAYANITAFILLSNGAPANSQPLTASTDVVIRT